MTATELRKQIIARIQATKNEKVLEEVIRLLDLDVLESDAFILNESQKKAVTEAEEQIQEGQCVTDEEASQEIEKWLNR